MGKGRRRRRRQKQSQSYLYMGSNKTPKKRDKKKKQKQQQTTSVAKTGTTSHSSYSYKQTLPARQKAINPDNVIRTDKGCFEFFTSRAWGTVLVPVIDPEAHKVTFDEINAIKLIENFPKIPKELWARWISLCFHFCPDKPRYSSSTWSPTIHKSWDHKGQVWEYHKYVKGVRTRVSEAEYEDYAKSKKSGSTSSSSCGSHSGDLEVSMLLCRKADDLSQWRILIPKQTVTGGSVNADLSETIDIETGEKFDAFPPVGWVHAGSSHSHNTMAAFFSSIDDKSELTVPGLHIVVGRIDKKDMTYEHKSSIVLRQMRKKIELFDVVDAESVSDVTFHADVLEYITKRSYATQSSGYGYYDSIYDDFDTDYAGFFGYRGGYDTKDEHVNPQYVAWKKKQAALANGKGGSLDLAKIAEEGGPRGKVMGFHPETKKTLGGADTDPCLPIPSFDDPVTKDHSQQSLEDIERSLEDAINQGQPLDLREIAAYYERVNLPFDPEGWQ